MLASPTRDILAFADELVAFRRDLHTYPELGFEEHRTGDKVAGVLNELGIAAHRGLGGTGVVAVIEGRLGPGRSIGLRADMDALPMEQVSDVAWRSTRPGVFHGCGHDGHTTALLAAARYLAGNRNFHGRVVLIFQPAEEGLGGARRMIADGLFRQFPCDEIYALHNTPDLALGEVAVPLGPVMASADFFDIEISGRGGHAAAPHTTVDAAVVALTLAQALQSVVSRNVDPLQPAVVSITQIRAGSTYNVIADTAVLKGTIRTLSPGTRALVAKRVSELCAGIALGHNAAIKVDIRNVFSPLSNHLPQAHAMTATAVRLFGADKVKVDTPPAMTSEDFADMLLSVPGAYCWIGQGPGAALHNPGYQFNDALLPLAASLLAQVALDRLHAHPSDAQSRDV